MLIWHLALINLIVCNPEVGATAISILQMIKQAEVKLPS